MKVSILASFLFGASSVYGAASTLKQITENIGSNPNNVPFYIYVPNTLAAKPAVVVAAHYCGGSAQAYFSGTQYANLADQYGYIVIYPSSPRSGACWDVSTTASLTHNGGSDSLGIVNMVKWTINKYSADAGKVFITGTSSGAMMTNLMMGAYPDVFAGGAAFAGVPYGCFKTTDPGMWNSQCSTGKLIKTPQQWGDDVRNAYPGYTGPRPRFIALHGTNDETLNYQNLIEDNKQWSNVFGISFTRNTTNTPINGWTEMIYGDGTQYRAYSAQGVSHNIPTQETFALKWFGIIPGGPVQVTTSRIATTTPAPVTTTPRATTTPVFITTTRSTTAVTTTAVVVPTTSASVGTVARWQQCGGTGYTGSTACVAPYTCKSLNPYYSQCL